MEVLLAAQVAEQDEVEECATGFRAKLLTRMLNDSGGCTARSAFLISLLITLNKMLVGRQWCTWAGRLEYGGLNPQSGLYDVQLQLVRPRNTKNVHSR